MRYCRCWSKNERQAIEIDGDRRIIENALLSHCFFVAILTARKYRKFLGPRPTTREPPHVIFVSLSVCVLSSNISCQSSLSCKMNRPYHPSPLLVSFASLKVGEASAVALELGKRMKEAEDKVMLFNSREGLFNKEVPLPFFIGKCP